MVTLEPRQKIQLAIAVGLIVLAAGTEASYILERGFSDDLVKQIVRDYHILIAAGIGAALAIFGLGRSVQAESKTS